MSNSKKGVLYLIPNTLGLSFHQSSIPPAVLEEISDLRIFIVEHSKAARKLLKMLEIKTPQSDLELHELNKHTSPDDKNNFIQPLLNGHHVGLISDAGCPGIADPGAEIVATAHRNKIKVKPLVGPSSILLALMASGFNGQHFAFHGYLPKERKERISALRQLETASEKTGQAQLFIETPYRNNHIIEDVLSSCKSNTLFCVAANLTLDNEIIISQPLFNWKPTTKFNKQAAVFLLQAQHNYS
jgi:16S rRNA (cytidine1402-2'-O)-methyltransferase